ncbi:MAG: HD domain-containing protein, partial [Trebonia sp.]
MAVARRLAALAAGAPKADKTADAADAVRPLIAAHRRVFPGADAGLLRHAYAVADHWHSGQVRKSGAPYITHPLAVAILLADIGMDTTTLAAALLHDTVEDTGLTIGQVKAEFGAEVAVLVDGVTKLDGSRWGDHAEGETFRKMILAASIDLRVLVIKLADRVHNLRTLGHHPKREKRERIARASMELLVPFAQRLGLYAYQRELEDLAFATLSPRAHERVAALVRQTEDERGTALDELITGMRTELDAAGVRAQVEARARHLYSIHRGLPGGAGGWISGAGVPAVSTALTSTALTSTGPANNVLANTVLSTTGLSTTGLPTTGLPSTGVSSLRPTDASRVVVVVDG